MYQPNYHPKSKAANVYENLLAEKSEQTKIKIEARTDEIQEIQEIQQVVKEEVEANNTWQNTQAKRQNLTPTLLEIEEDNQDNQDDQLEDILTSSLPSINTPSIMLDYKLIGLNKVEQFNYFKKLVEPSLQQRWQNQTKPIKLRGILAEADRKKIGLVLADVATNHRIAEIISLVVLPEYPNVKIGTKLIECLKIALPKINCDQLKLNPQAEAIINRIQFSI